MIYIEVIFGAINGNALDVDSALSRTSTNPVQNKVIAAALDLLQRNIDAVAGSITKDVVEVATYDYLAEIEEPRTDVIYVTTDTNKLYLYDADAYEFNDVTNTNVDNTIYVTDLDSLFDMNLTAGMYAVAYTHRIPAGSATTMYSLSVSMSSRPGIGRFVQTTNMILANAGGYAVKDYDDNDEPVWVWQTYSLDGHTHSTSEVTGLPELLLQKQDKTDNSLNTDAKTIVGAINEVNQIRKREYSVNFYGVNGTALEHNLSGHALTIGKIVSTNVRALSYSIQDGVQNQSITLVNGQWVAGGTPASIVIPDGAQVAWKATRIDDSEIAEITIKEA